MATSGTDKAGHVYAAEFGRRGIKIGRSISPELRLNTLSRHIKRYAGLKVKRTFISPACANFIALEGHLHEMFADRRIDGELFRIDFEEAVEAIGALPFEAVEADVAEANPVDPSADPDPNRGQIHITEDEWTIIRTFRALGLERADAIRAFAFAHQAKHAGFEVPAKFYPPLVTDWQFGQQ